MARKTANTPKFVVCVDNAGYEVSLELHKIYRVLPDEQATADGDVRVVDESGEDYLFPATRFEPIEVPTNIRKAILRAG